MKLTITTLGDDIFPIDVSDDMELENLKALLEFESGVPSGQMTLVANGQPLLGDKKKLKEFGLKEGDVMLLQRGQPQQSTQPAASRSGGMPMIDFGSIQIPGMGGNGGSSAQAGPSSGVAGGQGLPNDPATIRNLLLSSPHELALLKERNPPLAEALLSGDLAKFASVLQRQQQERADRERQRIRMLTADPFDADVQNQIAEEIRLKNVETNMETAMEYNPESFGQVVMLYVDCVVNGHPVKAFVDSGAQMTIMSQACAERCNIMRLVDKRWVGIAKGVGTQKIIGRVHLCEIKIGKDFLQSSFTILEEQPMDMLLGLDMLKRHQCVLDLKRNCLVIGTTNNEAPFLPEGELPEHARLNRQVSDNDEDRQLAEALSKSAQEAASQAPSGSGTSPASKSTNSPSASTPASTSAPSQQHNFAEADVKRLTDYGFSRQQVIQELQNAQGNVDQALAALFAKSFHVP